MVIRPRSDVELSDAEFERLLDLVDVLHEVQLLRLQCKVAALLGDPPQWREPFDTSPPPSGLSGPYALEPPAVVSEYEELAIDWEDATDPGV